MPNKIERQSLLSLRQLQGMIPGVVVTELLPGHKTISILNGEGEYRCKHIPDKDFYLTPEQFTAKHLLADTTERYRRPKDDPNRLIVTRAKP